MGGRRVSMVDTVSLGFAQGMVAAHVHEWVNVALNWTSTEAKPVPVHALGATLGGGKSHGGLKGAVSLLAILRAKDNGRVVGYAVPEHALSDQIAARFMVTAMGTNLRAATWRGREAKSPTRPGEKMCARIEDVRDAQSLLLDIDKEVCAECPFRDSCEYLFQREEDA